MVVFVMCVRCVVLSVKGVDLFVDIVMIVLCVERLFKVFVNLVVVFLVLFGIWVEVGRLLVIIIWICLVGMLKVLLSFIVFEVVIRLDELVVM